MNGENVILIVMDTTRFGTLDIGSNLCSMENTFSSSPWTLPSHASIFTSEYSSNHGAHANHKSLNDYNITIAEILSNKGYETVAVSNNVWISENFGFGSGFETFYKVWQYQQSDTDLGKISQTEEGFDQFWEATKAIFNGNPVTDFTNAIYGKYFRRANDDGAARTNKWITNWLTTRNDSRPFFLFVNYLEPHLDYRPPKEHAEDYLPEDVTYKEAMNVSQNAWAYIADKIELTEKDFNTLRALYRAEVAYLEEKIEELIQLLKSEGEWEDTLFIITSDHGENIGEHGLMDHQYALYDTLLHVPLYVHGGPFENGKVEDLIQPIDISPTILDVLDIEAPKAREQFQGISFHPDINQSREYIVAEYMAPQPSMEALETKISDLPDHVYEYDRSLRAIRTNQYKYIRGSDGSQELYDIQNDPVEQNNLVEEKRTVVHQLDTALDEWLESFEQADQSKSISMDDSTKSRLEDLGYLQ